MAKKTKSVLQKKTTPMTEVVHKRAPAIAPGLVSISMAPNDLVTLTNLMSICAKVFEEQANTAALANNDTQFTISSARHKLTSMFAGRFAEFCNIPEPESRDMH